MATTSDQQHSTAGENGSQTEPSTAAPLFNRPVRRRRSRLGVFLLLLLVAAGSVGVVFATMPSLKQALLDRLAPSKTESAALTHSVSRERLLVTVTEDGNVESASNVDVKCQVAGGATILWIVEDGKLVEEGEVLVRLDDSNLLEQVNTQKIAYEKAMAAKIQAEEDFEAAKIAVREYAEGTFVKELQDVEAQITIALENLRSSENLLEHTERMARKGFATPLQLEADQFAVRRSQLELDSARTAKKVLEEFTKPKMLKQLESTRDAAAARARSEMAAFELEKARLERLEAQLKNCVITAPQQGMVVYANDASRSRFGGNTTPQVEEGATVREQQALIRLPDLSNMQVKVTVHETKVDQIRPGMPARIVIQDRQLTGTVVSVANQPEPTSFFSANVKEYATIVKVDGTTQDLKPGMTAEVEILIADLPDVLTLPVAAVVEQRGKFYAWVQTPNGPDRRPLVLGMTNDKVVEIKDGVLEGENVLLNPRALVDEAQTEGPPVDEDGEKRFGSGDPAVGKPEGDAPQAKSNPAPASPAEGGRPRRGRSGGGGASRLMQADQDGDGKISREEAPSFMQSFFDRLDGNGDGFVDQQEAAAAAARRRRQQGAERGDGGGPGPGGPGGGEGQ